MDLSTAFLTIFIAAICLYYYVLRNFFYFERLNIPHVRPIPLLGNIAPLIFQRKSFVEIIRNIYDLFPNAKYVGFYDLTRPIYLIRDPNLISTIAIKHFDNFTDHNNFVSDREPMAGKNVFGMRSDTWREMRQLLSPAFTSSKMKIMFGLMCECAENLTNFLLTQSGNITKTYDMKDIMCKYTNDVMATCAYGISTNSFKNPNNEFFSLGKNTFIFSTRLSVMFFVHAHFPRLTRLFKLRMFSVKVENFFKDIVNNTMKIRDEQKIVRPDMIQLMMKTRNKNQGPKFDLEEMAAQAFIFFFGGFDTSSTNMCFLTHEIAGKPDVKNKLREEIDYVLRKTNGKPSYETIRDMKYLDAVVSECLRMYPVANFLDRVCVKEFELPPSTSDGKSITLKPGDTVWFSSYALHHDPKYYSHPNKFDPDRFLNGDVDNSTYIPFGIGPRICIGYRFARLQIKIMLFYLLWRCDIEPVIKNRDHLILSTKSYNMASKEGFWLQLKARESKDL